MEIKIDILEPMLIVELAEVVISFDFVGMKQLLETTGKICIPATQDQSIASFGITIAERVEMVLKLEISIR